MNTEQTDFSRQGSENLNKIKAVFLDFGGVLYDIDHSLTLNSLKRLSVTPEKLDGLSINGLNLDILKKYEKGEITSSEFREKMREMFGLIASDDEFDSAWCATLKGPYPEAARIVREFGAVKDIFLISNTNEIHFSRFYPQVKDMFAEFNKLFISFKLGMHKPDPEIYLHSCREAGYEPSESIFADDSADNIICARQIGMAGIHINERGKLSDLLHTVKKPAQQ
ncbi:MAG: HAD family hydrolase [Candidatus Kapaibacterium sp.]